MTARPWDLVRDAVERGERDAQLLDGRAFNADYWRNARRQLTNLRRKQERLEGERDALRAVVDAGERPQ